MLELYIGKVASIPLLIMARIFIKRGGKKVPFRAEKVKKSVRGACKDAHIGGARAKKIVSKVAGPVLRFAAKRKSVKFSVVRQKILAGLRKVEPKVYKAWLRYDKRRRARRGK